jgi:hypothetical protein
MTWLLLLVMSAQAVVLCLIAREQGRQARAHKRLQESVLRQLEAQYRRERERHGDRRWFLAD